MLTNLKNIYESLCLIFHFPYKIIFTNLKMLKEKGKPKHQKRNMNLKSENKSFNSIFQEITEKALQYSDKPGEYFEYLCLQIQELIGTRVVLIATKSENNTSRILSAVPSPNSEWYNQIEIQQLIEYAFQLNKTQYLDAETTNETIKKLLKNLEIENIINSTLLN